MTIVIDDPAGTCAPSISRSQEAERPKACTGLSNRRVSSTTAGTNSRFRLHLPQLGGVRQQCVNRVSDQVPRGLVAGHEK